MTNPEGPQQLGNYRLIRRLGSGGFADVYLGEHIHLGRQAAIKVLKPQEDKTGQADFLEEARRAAILQHPNIISILDFGIENDLPFLVMDYAPFGTLLKRHPRSTRVALETVQGYIRQVASALQYAHQLKVIHRDVKPENMLIGTGGKILLGDFGIAIVAHRPETMSAQVAAGTAVYMAPEQARGFACPESDQYALAIVVYEWLCGFPPFSGTSLAEILIHHEKDMPQPLRQRVPELSPTVDDVVLRALAKQPQQRFPTIMDFAIALEQVAVGQQPIRLSGNSTTEVATNDPTIYQPADQAEIPTPRKLRKEGQPTPAQFPSLQTFLDQSYVGSTPKGSEAQYAGPVGSAEGRNTGELPLSAFVAYFTVPQERIQLALILESQGIWLVQHGESVARLGVDVGEYYRHGLSARARGQLEAAILWWLRGLLFQPHYRNGALVRLVKEGLHALSPQHLAILRNRMEQARKQGDLDEEIRLLEEMQSLAPEDQVVGEQLGQARQDKEYEWMYQNARQYLEDGNEDLAIEQVNLLQSWAPAFRGLPGLREQTIVFMNTHIQQSMSSDDFPRAQQQLQQLRRLAPADRRFATLAEKWCQQMYQKAQKSLQGSVLTAALAQINAIREILPLFKGGLEHLRAIVYTRMCDLAKDAIYERRFTEAQQQLDEIEQSFAPIERKAFTPLPPVPSGEAAPSVPRVTRKIDTTTVVPIKSSDAIGRMAAEMSNYPSTYDRLRELLHERLALHIAKQQQVLFWQGEKARRRRDYTEAKRLWQELQQQNSDFVTTNFASGKKIPIARYLELLVIEQAKRAERVGDWQQAQTLWQEVKGTWPSNRQAPGRLKNATLNLRYVPIYQQAEQYVAQKQIEQARPLLEEVWKNAPRFGDPAKLAKPTGLHSPLLSVDVVFNVCLVGGLGIVVGLLAQIFLHGNLLIDQLWGVLASLVVASIVILMMFNVRKGKPIQYGAIVISGGVITVVAILLLIQH